MVVGSVEVKREKVKNIYERALMMADAIQEIIEFYGLSDRMIAIEEPIIKFKNSMSLVRSNGIFVQAMRERFNMGFIDVPNNKWCAYNLIKGNNKKGKDAPNSRKQQSIDVLRKAKLVPEEMLNDDMADAYCILKYMLKK